MAYTNTEKQSKFKQKMYDAGFKQSIVWVKRIEPNPVKMNTPEFVRRLKKLTANFDDGQRSALFNLLIKIAKSKKEELKLKQK